VKFDTAKQILEGHGLSLKKFQSGRIGFSVTLDSSKITKRDFLQHLEEVGTEILKDSGALISTNPMEVEILGTTLTNCFFDFAYPNYYCFKFESEGEDLMAVGRKLRRILSRAIPELRNLKGVVDMTPMSVEL
jgi:hypothetical protein